EGRFAIGFNAGGVFHGMREGDGNVCETGIRNKSLNSNIEVNTRHLKKHIRSFYHFLPVQLLLLHFRKYQMLLIFWIVLFTAILGDFAAHFGAASLFLSPEYIGVISHPGFFILGAATAVFSMSWHITTFIIHSKRLPFLGATRHSFLKYCFNNAVIPLCYLLIFGWLAARFLVTNENRSTVQALTLIGSFYLGYIIALLLSFLYFFSVDRNILKTALSKLANP